MYYSVLHSIGKRSTVGIRRRELDTLYRQSYWTLPSLRSEARRGLEFDVRALIPTMRREQRFRWHALT